MENFDKIQQKKINWFKTNPSAIIVSILVLTNWGTKCSWKGTHNVSSKYHKEQGFFDFDENKDSGYVSIKILT